MPDLPPYPPPHSVVDYPPPLVRRAWFWVALALSVLGLAAMIVGFAVLVVVGQRDFPGQIDDPALVSVIDEQCEIMTETVESLTITGSPLRQAETISLENKAVKNMVKAVRAEAERRPDDRPVQGWLDDWESLIAAREAFAAGVAEGFEEDLDIPRGPDGVDIYVRMDAVGACGVPEDLLNPYPGAEASV